MTVAAIIVTRGDVDLSPLLVSLPAEWEKIVWDNGAGQCRVDRGDDQLFLPADDVKVYGRYAAIEHTEAEVIYVQDDDVIVSDPAALVSAWIGSATLAGPVPDDGSYLSNVETRSHVVCNMPPEFRHDFYEEHALVGFGAAFHRDAPVRAFERFQESAYGQLDADAFYRTCDVVFTGLTPRVLVDVPKEDLPYAHYETRMWKQPGHQADRVRTLDLVRQVAA